MKLSRFWLSILAIAVSGFLGSPSLAQPAPSGVPSQTQKANPTFTQEQILTLMAKIRQLEDTENVSGLMAYLAPFIVSRVTIDAGDERVSRVFEGLSAHQTAMEESFGSSTSKEVLYQTYRVRFDQEGNMAIVTRYSVKAITTQENQVLTSMTRDVMRIAMVENQPKIISVVTDGWLEDTPPAVSTTGQ